MGILADAALEAGGEVVGVIPQALMDKELAHGGLSELLVVGTMHERKARMADLADAFLALPGGYGTFEELCEVLTWTQLGVHASPCGLLDVDGFYDQGNRFKIADPRRAGSCDFSRLHTQQRKPLGPRELRNHMRSPCFYDPLLALFDRAVTDGFLRPEHRALVLTAGTAMEVLDGLAAWEPAETAKWIDRSSGSVWIPRSEMGYRTGEALRAGVGFHPFAGRLAGGQHWEDWRAVRKAVPSWRAQ